MILDQPIVGHTPVRHGPADWRCKCGVGLSGGPCGPGRIGARDVMRFHRIDLWHPKWRVGGYPASLDRPSYLEIKKP
jgi:hypothetical protein